MNNFQTILVAIFLAFFVFAVLIFSGVLKIGKTNTDNNITGKIVVWGTFPSDKVSNLFSNLAKQGDPYSVSYVEKKEANYQDSLIKAFAEGNGPDLFILPSDMVFDNNNFVYKIPYTSFPEKTFRTSFIDGADIYMSKEGILGYPLVVDPMVLYYNKNMLSNEGLVSPVSFWDELFDLSGKLTKKKGDVINESMIAFGQYDNVNHAKDIISLLLLQSGNRIITPADKSYKSTIADDSSLQSIVNFFLEFSNRSNDVYSWNRSLPNSFDMFTSGKLAFYPGYASELFKIQSINPNLSFDVSMIPQTKGTNIKRTYAKIYSLAINKNSKNLKSSFGVASVISSSSFVKELGATLSLPSAIKSLLADKPSDPYLLTFFDEAIISSSWFDPDKNSTDSIFRELIENSLSSKLSVSDSINKADNQINLLIKNK